MSEQIIDANIPTVVRFRKIVQFARELDVKCDANWITPLVAFAKLEAVAEGATDDTVDSMIADELSSQQIVGDVVQSIGQVDGQVGVLLTWDRGSLLPEGSSFVSSDMIGGTLPAGVTYDNTTFIVSGTPEAATDGIYLLEFANVFNDGVQDIESRNLVIAPAA